MKSKLVLNEIMDCLIVVGRIEKCIGQCCRSLHIELCICLVILKALSWKTYSLFEKHYMQIYEIMKEPVTLAIASNNSCFSLLLDKVCESPEPIQVAASRGLLEKLTRFLLTTRISVK